MRDPSLQKGLPMTIVYLLTAIILLIAVGAAANVIGELVTKK